MTIVTVSMIIRMFSYVLYTVYNSHVFSMFSLHVVCISCRDADWVTVEIWS